MAWVRHGGDSPRIFWLNGMAATGKSAIARTVARQCLNENRLGASFFFRRGGGELETAQKLVTTIVVQLAQSSAALKRHICSAVAANPSIRHNTLNDQWKRLVLCPFQKLGAADTQPQSSSTSTPSVIILDALDECSNQQEVESILQMLLETLSMAHVPLKIFVTS
jgi:hypothetical protein